jgi:hypothetical protein
VRANGCHQVLDGANRAAFLHVAEHRAGDRDHQDDDAVYGIAKCDRQHRCTDQEENDRVLNLADGELPSGQTRRRVQMAPGRSHGNLGAAQSVWR